MVQSNPVENGHGDGENRFNKGKMMINRVEEQSPLHQRQVSDTDPSPVGTFSLDLDEDDEDDDEINGEIEADLRRYSSGRSMTTNSGRGYLSCSPRRCWRRLVACPKCMWHSFQSVRAQARQRRAQLLLEQMGGSEEPPDWRQSFRLCLVTSCDATDRGILIVAGFVIVWGFLVWKVRYPAVQRGILLGGFVLLIVRLGTRPLLNYLRVGNRRNWESRLPQALPQESPSKHKVRGINGETHGNLELPSLDEDGIFRKDDRCNRLRTTSDGSPPGIFISGSNESDPTIAAI